MEELDFEYATNWKQLQTTDFWQLAIMQEVSRIRRRIKKHKKNENPPTSL